MTLEEAAAAAHRMGLGNHTKWSPKWWEPILKEQRGWKAVPLQAFKPEDFDKARTRPSNKTIEERRRTDPTVVAGSVVWSQVWELLSIAEYAPKWKLEENKHTKKMIKKLARNRNAVLQLLAQGVLGKNTQEANELVQAEMGVADYCHDCQGGICDSVCAPYRPRR